MSKKDKSGSVLASGLKESLESLQASLDEWAEVEDQVKSGKITDTKDITPKTSADQSLMQQLRKQIENLSS
jgi:hypothetical protein